jgi:outer membrane lipopolysaccharide assembly protein LptE/RlpB
MTSRQRSAPAFRYAQLVLVMLLAAALVSACGFRLRGSTAAVATFPEDFRQIYVEAPVEISDELAIFLERGGATVSKSQAEADAVMKVQSEDYQQRVVAVDATTGKAREFELVYTLDFSVRMKNGIMLVLPEHITIRRVFVFDPTAVIGATQNVEALRVDMRRDAAERMIRLTTVALGQ